MVDNNFIFFPYEPYKTQAEFINKIINFLETPKQKVAILESPTGTGKSLSILSSCLFYLNKEAKSEPIDKSKNTTTSEKLVTSNEDDWITNFGKKRSINKASINTEISSFNKINKNENLTFSDMQKRMKTSNVKLEKALIKDESQEDKDQILYDNIVDNINDMYSSDMHDTTNYILNNVSSNQKQIIYLTRTHSQIKQIVSEFRKIKVATLKKKKEFNFTCSSVGSRKIFCLNSKVNSLISNSYINEKCKELISSSKEDEKCKFYSDDIYRQSLADKILLESYDIEDINQYGKVNIVCPYFATKLNISRANVLFMPYNSLIQAKIRKSLEVSLTNKIIVFDEAHNLIDNILNTHSVDLSLNDIMCLYIGISLYLRKYSNRLNIKNQEILNQIKDFCKRLISFIFKLNLNNKESTDYTVTYSNNKLLQSSEGKEYSLCEFLLEAELPHIDIFKLNTFIDISEIGHKIKYIISKTITEIDKGEDKSLINDISVYLSEIKLIELISPNKDLLDIKELLRILKMKAESNTLTQNFQSFLLTINYLDKDGKIFIIQSEEDNIFKNIESKLNKIKFIMLNAKREFESILRSADKIIFLGGTLKPYDELKLLFNNLSSDQFIEYEADHIIPERNLLAKIIPSTFKGEELIFSYDNIKHNGNKYFNSILVLLLKITSIIKSDTNKEKPKGIVVFLPTFEFLNSLRNFINQGKYLESLCIHFESKGYNVFNPYKKDIESYQYSSVILFAVIGSNLSEGINFNDSLARVVIIVGMPYPNLASLEIKSKRSYYDMLYKEKQSSMTGNDYYENLCFKSVNQAIGRSIRHINDYSMILLVDKRYSDINKIAKLPKWANFQVEENIYQLEEDIQHFFNLMEIN